MTSTMHDALKRMSVIREGFVVRNLDGSHKTDDQADKAIQRICRKAGLPARTGTRFVIIPPSTSESSTKSAA